MALPNPLQEGLFYRTRDGKKVEIFKTGLTVSGNNPGFLEALGLLYYPNGTVKNTTWYEDGNYRRSDQDKDDLVMEWVEPSYTYRPVFKETIGLSFLSLDSAIDEAGRLATADNPLISYLEIDTAGLYIKVIKPGTPETE